MDQQVQDKKTAIMNTALKLFTERGFHGTSTAQISKESGVGTGTLFNYFPTKEELINSLYWIASGVLKDYTPELTMTIYFHGTKALVSLILDPNVSLDTEELIENGFRIIWNGLTGE